MIPEFVPVKQQGASYLLRACHCGQPLTRRHHCDVPRPEPVVQPEPPPRVVVVADTAANIRLSMGAKRVALERLKRERAQLDETIPALERELVEMQQAVWEETNP